MTVLEELNKAVSRLPSCHSLTWSVQEDRGRIELTLWTPAGYTFETVRTDEIVGTSALQDAISRMLSKFV